MSSEKKPNRLISFPKAALLLDVSPKTVQRLVERGALRAVNLHKGLIDKTGYPLQPIWRIRESEVERLVNGQD